MRGVPVVALEDQVVVVGEMEATAVAQDPVITVLRRPRPRQQRAVPRARSAAGAKVAMVTMTHRTMTAGGHRETMTTGQASPQIGATGVDRENDLTESPSANWTLVLPLHGPPISC